MRRWKESHLARSYTCSHQWTAVYCGGYGVAWPYQRVRDSTPCGVNEVKLRPGQIVREGMHTSLAGVKGKYDLASSPGGEGQAAEYAVSRIWFNWLER
jgi:hypothetical protein